ncbi:hypothetical protein BDZ89DRAFT_122594 [Hymenopellis radicata]|nr:hypothetical protein BDZ89DRAFT_122594 [Hymenopellis radicata]
MLSRTSERRINIDRSTTTVRRPRYPYARIPESRSSRNRLVQNAQKRVEDSHEMKAHGMTEATYKDDELIRISTRPICAFENDVSVQSMTPQKLATALRDREMILLSCSTAFRGDSSRILQLSDLELYQLRLIDQGYDVYAPCAIFIANQGKTNTDGNLERHGCIRHRIPEICCIGGLGFHFFGEYHLLKRPAPDFSVEPNFGAFGRRKWYGLHLFRGGNSDYEPLSYDTHLKRTKAIHEDAGLKLKNATHAGRHYVGETAMYAGHHMRVLQNSGSGRL